jgi:hypothetical protein
MASPALRPRGIGEILDLGFQLYRQRWVSMVTATLVLVLPVLLVEALGPLGFVPMAELIANLFFMAAGAAGVVIASGAYMGQDVGAGQAIAQVGRRFLSVWCATVFQSVLILLGLVLLVIPGILAMAYTFAMQQAVMIEGCSADESFARSSELARGHLKPILLTSVLSILITFLVATGIDQVVMRVVPSIRMQFVAMNVVMAALNPVVAAIGTVLYYDLRIRKEAFDVAVATERLEAAAPVPAF